MFTGAILSGNSTNKVNRPTIYLEKYYPIEGRKDFYKWCIVTPEGIAKDYKGNEMYFDSLEQAKLVRKAIIKVRAKKD